MNCMSESAERCRGGDQEIATLTHEFGVAPVSSSTSGPVDLGALSVIRKEQE